jgi:hypothetical protein
MRQTVYLYIVHMHQLCYCPEAVLPLFTRFPTRRNSRKLSYLF